MIIVTHEVLFSRDNSAIVEESEGESEKENGDRVHEDTAEAPAPASSIPPKKKRKKEDRVETAILEYINTVSGTNSVESQFGQYVGSSLMRLSTSRRRMAKLRIQVILNELEDEEEKEMSALIHQGCSSSSTQQYTDVFERACDDA